MCRAEEGKLSALMAEKGVAADEQSTANTTRCTESSLRRVWSTKSLLRVYEESTTMNLTKSLVYEEVNEESSLRRVYEESNEESTKSLVYEESTKSLTKSLVYEEYEESTKNLRRV